jgi:hypothetical protein
MAEYSSMNYARLTKGGFLLGVGLLLFGALGGIVGKALFGTLPEWETTLFLFSEGTGILIGVFSVCVFGVIMPLVE